MKLVRCFISIAMLIGPSFAYAEAGDINVNFELGVYAGGDEITAAATTSGTQTVDAGAGIAAAIGADYDLTDELSLAVLVGFNEDSITAENGNIKFTRTTLDALVKAKVTDLFWIGGGVTYHTGVKLSADGAGSFYVQDDTFKDATGFLIDAKFDVGEPGSFYISVRMTSIEYESETGINGKDTYSGNGLGIIWGGEF